MAHVSGPTSSMPNSKHSFPENTKCDDHPDRPAVSRRQGETDSFGAEYHDLCEECEEGWVNALQGAGRSGVCDWCGVFSQLLSNKRDLDEGMAGPIYKVCNSCTIKENDIASQELDYLQESDYFPDDNE